MSQDRDESQELGMTIGAVARATSIPANTIRTWERRYGFPEPTRTDGNQRLYAPEIVPHLRLVAEALKRGHRPRQVLGLQVDQLRELLGPTSVHMAGTEALSPSEVVDSWVRSARELDGEALDLGFAGEWARLGAMAFLEQRAAPFLERVGDEWARGVLTVYQEHAASQRLREFLAARWRPLSDRAFRQSVVCATLPGETHELGLHMAATVAALRGHSVVYLGPDTPVEEIAGCAARMPTVAVLISVSRASDSARVVAELKALRAALHPSVPLVAGGGGAPEVDGVQRIGSLTDLEGWLARLPAR